MDKGAVEPSTRVHPSIQIEKNTLKELTTEERTNSENILSRKTSDKELLVGFLNIQSLTNTIKGEKNFDIYHLMNDKNLITSEFLTLAEAVPLSQKTAEFPRDSVANS